jgi:hypothetical protein
MWFVLALIAALVLPACSPATPAPNSDQAVKTPGTSAMDVPAAATNVTSATGQTRQQRPPTFRQAGKPNHRSGVRLSSIRRPGSTRPSVDHHNAPPISGQVK